MMSGLNMQGWDLPGFSDDLESAEERSAYNSYLRWIQNENAQLNLWTWLNSSGQRHGGRRNIYCTNPRAGSFRGRMPARDEGCFTRFWQWLKRNVCCIPNEPQPELSRRMRRPPPEIRDIMEMRTITREQFLKILSEKEQLALDYFKEKYITKLAEYPLEDMIARKNDLPKDEEIAFSNQAKENFLFAQKKDLSDDEELEFSYQAKQNFLNIFCDLSGEPSDNQFAVVFADYLMKVFDTENCSIWKIEAGENKDSPKYCLLVKQTDNTLTLKEWTPHEDLIEAAGLSRCAISNRSEEPSSEQDKLNLKTQNTSRASQAMLVPILVRKGETLFIIELFREKVYSPLDLEIANSCCVWGSMAYFYCMGMIDKTLQHEMRVNLISTLKSIFHEMLSLDVVIQRILKFVQHLVNADRASFFMVDRAKNELVSTVFDQKLDGESREKREIRIPMDRGIAGLVATTGEVMNIPDAYKDDRFNREIDEATGYKTTSILCMPVKVDGQVIGVVQMVNKRDATSFFHNDIYSFGVFEQFFGLALHHAQLYETIAHNKQKYKVALEVLSYHITSKDHEVKELIALEPHKTNHILHDLFLDPHSLNAKEKCQAVIIMFDDLFGMAQFDSMELTRFTLTVMKNYRNVPYHNFDHGWAVAQTTYSILKKDTDGHFNNKQRLALFVGSLCHDLDHRGFTNKYTSETESPLAAMYTTSTLEYHHFYTTVGILQQEGHNIFSKFTAEEYKEILSLIRVCILATDLAVFYQNVYEVRKILFTQQRFDWSSTKMQEYAMALSMTAADLSASAKPWDVQIKTVLVIMEEFYTQGDKERAAGRTPIAMMDRTKPEELPISQVGFLTSTCIPCYKTLKQILPGTANLYNMAEKNLQVWEEKVKEKEKEKATKKSTEASSSKA